MRALIRDGLVSLVALVLWPALVLAAAAVLIRRAKRGDRVVSRRDIVWLGRRTVVATGAGLTLWIMATALIACASIFMPIPDI